MKIDYDPNKSLKNAVERDLPFDKVTEFNWETARTNPDDNMRIQNRGFHLTDTYVIDCTIFASHQYLVGSE